MGRILLTQSICRHQTFHRFHYHYRSRHWILPLNRSFSTTTHRQKVSDNDIYNLTKTTPSYPYGPRKLYKQSNFGLYGLARPQFGNRVADSEFKTKTRRRWGPNVQRKQVFSEALDRRVRLKMTARVLRTLDKVGGLDNYLLGDKARRIKELGPKGWTLRWQIMNTPAVQERLAKKREELGLGEVGAEQKKLREKFDIMVKKLPGPKEMVAGRRLRAERKDVLWPAGRKPVRMIAEKARTIEKRVEPLIEETELVLSRIQWDVAPDAEIEDNLVGLETSADQANSLQGALASEIKSLIATISANSEFSQHERRQSRKTSSLLSDHRPRGKTVEVEL